MVMEYGVWITDIEKCCHSLYFSLGPRLLTRLCSQLPSECSIVYVQCDAVPSFCLFLVVDISNSTKITTYITKQCRSYRDDFASVAIIANPVVLVRPLVKL